MRTTIEDLITIPLPFVFVAYASQWLCHDHCHGTAMPWHHPDSAMALPSNCHGNDVEVPWQCHGRAMALPRQCRGRPICSAMPGQCHGIANAKHITHMQLILACTTRKRLHDMIHHAGPASGGHHQKGPIGHGTSPENSRFASISGSRILEPGP